MRNPSPARMATLALLAASTLAATPALAAALAAVQPIDLTGTQVLLQYDYGAQPAINDSVTVGAGIEITCTGGGSGNANVCSLLTAGTQTLDFDADSITYAYSGPAASFTALAINRMRLRHSLPGLVLGGVALQTTVAGFDASRVSFDAGSVSIDWSGVAVADGNLLRLQLLPVPESTTAVLLSAGLLLGWGWQRYRRQA